MRCFTEAELAAYVDSQIAARSIADTSRLDWLDAVNQRTNERIGTVYGWKFDLNHNRAALSDHNLPALTVRQAIDKARGISTGFDSQACFRVGG